MENIAQFEPLTVNTHRDFRGHMKEIVTRLNQNPQLAKLSLVNPVYALSDLGVQLSAEMKQHVFETFHNPPAKRRRLAELEKEIQAEAGKLPGGSAISAAHQDRTELLFGTLKLERLSADHGKPIAGARLAAYAHQHPLIQKLVEYDVVRRSGLVFHTREVYDAYKRGEVKQQWVGSVRFGPNA